MEILVVIVIMGIIGLILTNILSQVLRGQNKVNVIDLVKQNGQVVLDKLSNEIRSAEELICVGSTPPDPFNSIVVFKNGNYTRFRFVKPTTSTNGYFSREDFTKDYFNDDVTYEMLCTETGVTRGQLSFLTDKNNNGISINYDGNAPIFQKQVSQASFPELILIKFRAREGINAGKTSENTVSDEGVLFTTAVSVRGGK